MRGTERLSLVDEMKRAVVQHENDRHMAIVVGHISAAMAPFRPMDVRLVRDDMLASYPGVAVLVARISNVPSWYLKCTVDVVSHFLDADELAHAFGAGFAEEIKAMPRVEPGSNIQLGEE